jgi:protein gp37
MAKQEPFNMNKQVKLRKDGSVLSRGIEWTDYTWNPIGGCQHGCRWKMPDGTIAICYAEEVATKLRGPKFYEQGFEHHYWHPDRLEEPVKLRHPSKIFMDSMSDLMGHWVPDEQIEQVLDVARRAEWHTFQLLTKNYIRLTKFKYPDNVWVGVSAPPTGMNGRLLDSEQQRKMVEKTLDVLIEVDAKVKWMSIEPLSFDIGGVFWSWRRRPLVPRQLPLNWMVIGAATSGAKVFQPAPGCVQNVLSEADRSNIPVFYKGNIEGNSAIKTWREEFPK